MKRFYDFDWDEQNENHVARHHVTPDEVEECFFNPDFASEKEEHDFWATHSSADYQTEETPEAIEFNPNARTQRIDLRIPLWMLEELKAIAADEGIPYQRLIKNCLKTFVAERKSKAVQPE